ncbi:MAG: NADH-quinone oxidoreductase subunit N [Acidimicrobiia bacterium]|nr:NADH-quinone oxidoreductase subunit N [Acidimicrobiia bacterium]
MIVALFAQQTSPEIVWSLILPFLILAIGGVVLVTITSLVPGLRGGGFPAAFTGAVAVVSGAFLVPVWNRVADTEGPQLAVADAIGVDGFTVFITAVICVAVFFAAMLLDEYLRRENLDGPEWYVLLLMSASGGVLLASAEDLIVTFLGLEILSIAAYVMAALHLRRAESQEAGFKYFLLGAVSSALFLYGIALVYGATGSTSLRSIAAAGVNEAGLDPGSESSLILAGMALLLVGFAFKVSAVPFHLWTPDVYEGAPTPVVAFMASGVKVAGFAGLVRVFWAGFNPYLDDWRPLIAGLAVLTLLLGSVLALAQRNVKRMLAYSSITHAGFMLVAVHAASTPGVGQLLGGEALLFYLFAYTVMIAGTFGVVTIVGGRGDGRHDLDDYRGLSHRYPLLAGLMSVLLFAQAGVPFTSGFFAKFRVIAAAARNESYWLAGIAMLAAVVAAVLYLRIVVSMFLVDDGPPTDVGDGDDEVAAGAGGAVIAPAIPRVTPALSAVVAVSIAAVVTVVLGLLPDIGGGVLTDAAATLASFR